MILVCGTNNLRNVKSDQDVVKLVELLRAKLTLIRQISPSTKTFVVPVFPTRNASMNKNIEYFNVLVDEMLRHCFSELWFPGVWQFLDSKGLLSLNLVRKDDDIHLGDKGIA